MGALVELVDVDAGYEAAFEAAAGEALSAVLMSDEEAARRGLAHLAEHNAAGAVIALAQGIRTGRATDGTALGDGPRPGEGPRPGDGPADELPTGARWLSGLVRSPQSAVTDLLSRLLARAVVVTGDWSRAVDLAVARPQLVIVTQAGDRCWQGIWRTGSHGTGATGAALEEARTALERATSEASRAAGAERAAQAEVQEARSAVSDARRGRGR